MKEFSLIAHYFAPLTQKGAFGLENDGALLKSNPSHYGVVTKDLLVEGVHFLAQSDPYLLAQKLLRVNLSDLAAMGATPSYYFLGMALPKHINENWISSFAAGLAADQATYNIYLMGGDSVRSPHDIMLSLTAYGTYPCELPPITRSNAQRGDKIYVTGTLGDSALGLLLLKQKITVNIETKHVINRYHLPQPQTKLGAELGHFTSCAMDISDGLLQDLEHICTHSRKGASLFYEKIPLSHEAQQIIWQNPSLSLLPLHGGDDYELLCIISPEKEEGFLKKSKELHVKVTEIGVMTEENTSVKARLYDANLHEMEVPYKGYQHF